MPNVFISYAREDLKRAQLLAEALQADGISVWWDHDLVGGDNFREQIDEVISSATVAIVIWSEHSVKSRFVRDEASRANERHVLLPVIIGDVSPPVGFGEIQSIQFKRWAETTAEWESLVRAVHARLRSAGEVRAPGSFDGARRNIQFFGRNADVFMLTMFTQGLACFLLFQPLHFFPALPVEAALGFVGILSLFVCAFQTWPIIAERSGISLRIVSFMVGGAVGLAGFYFSGIAIGQLGTLLTAEAGGLAGGLAIINGFVFFTYMLCWGTIQVIMSR